MKSLKYDIKYGLRAATDLESRVIFKITMRKSTQYHQANGRPTPALSSTFLTTATSSPLSLTLAREINGKL